MDLVLNGSAVDRQLNDGELSLVSIELAAFDGDVGAGAMPVPDPGAIDSVLGGQQLKINEAGTVIVDGFADDQQRERGASPPAGRQNTYTIIDDNALLYGFRISQSRPAETDRARLLAFAAAYLPALDTSWVLNSNNVSMPKKRYVGDDGLAELIYDIVEWAGKTVFIEGRRLHSHLLTQGRTCELVIDDTPVVADNVTTFAPGTPQRIRTPADLQNNIKAVGPKSSVTVTDPTSISDHDVAGLRHQARIEFPDAKSTSELTTLANNALLEGKAERLTYAIAIGPLDWVALTKIRPGDLMTVTAQAIGLSASVQRIAHITYTIWSGEDGLPAPGYWQAALELGAPRRYGRRRRRKITDTTGEPGEAETQVGDETATITYRRDDGPSEDGTWAVETANLKSGRSLTTNHPYTATPCPIGGGAWDGPLSAYVAWGFTAPVDADYVGLRLHTELTLLYHYSEGFYHDEEPGVSGPYGLYGYAGDTPLPSDIAGHHATGIYLGTVMSTSEFALAVDIAIPRSGVNWGGGSRIVMVPEFPLSPVEFVCDGSFPGDGWTKVSASESKVYPIGLADGAKGLLTVAPVGTQDGVNQTFTLPWGYLTVRKVWRNGVLLPADAYVATDGETIVMAGWAPIASDLVLVELVLA